MTFIRNNHSSLPELPPIRGMQDERLTHKGVPPLKMTWQDHDFVVRALADGLVSDSGEAEWHWAESSSLPNDLLAGLQEYGDA